MTKFTKFFISLALIGLSAGVNAQSAIMSGSFQFTNNSNIMNKHAGTIILQSSMQRFELPISDNIIIANLLPGLYTLDIAFQSGGRGGHTTRHSQTVEIESERRTICRMSANAMLSFSKEYDRNSMPILANNFHGRNDRHDFDHRRDEPKVVVVQPPMPQPVSDFDFNKLYNAVRNETFSDTKMSVLKTSGSFYQFFSSEQVKQLALLFTFDNDKLECVKYLAPKVLDVQNLPYIQEIFTFKSTKEDYLKFLNRM